MPQAEVVGDDVFIIATLLQVAERAAHLRRRADGVFGLPSPRELEARGEYARRGGRRASGDLPIEVEGGEEINKRRIQEHHYQVPTTVKKIDNCLVAAEHEYRKAQKNKHDAEKLFRIIGGRNVNKYSNRDAQQHLKPSEV